MGWYSDSDDDDRVLTDSLVIQLLGEEGREVVATRQERLGWKHAQLQADAEASKRMQKARKAAAADAAKTAMKSFAGASKDQRQSKQRSKGPRGSSCCPLPDSAVKLVMQCLVQTLEPGGLRGPDIVARVIAAAAQVCIAFSSASEKAFTALADHCDSCLQQRTPPELVEPLPENMRDYFAKPLKAARAYFALPGPQGWKFWDGVLHNTTGLKLPQLKEAARTLGVQVTGSKPELVVRLLGAFGLSAPLPAAVPARLMRILQLERTRINGLCVIDGSEAGCDAIRAAARSMRTARQPVGLTAWAALVGSGTGGLGGVRRELAAAGISSMQQLQEAAQQAEQQLKSETPEQRKVREAAELAEQQAELMLLVGEVEKEKQAKREREQLAGQLYMQYTGVAGASATRFGAGGGW